MEDTRCTHLVDEQEEMPVTCIQMSCEIILKICNPSDKFMRRTLYSEGANMVEVAAVDVGINSEKASDNGLDGVAKILRKRYA